jgi:signal transduction histidine kinase
MSRLRFLRRLDSLPLRFALASLAGAVLALLVVGIGVSWIGFTTFEHLMLAHGASDAESRAMFTESVMHVLVMASVAALIASILVALLLGRVVNRPIAMVAAAARRVGEGAYGGRVPRPSTPELSSLADSFNQMSASLRDQERMRQDLITNFAHELRTPLTNLQGYLQAMREGVMEPSAEIFASLEEEVGRLHRLSRSLDVLAAGAVGNEQAAVEIDMVPIIEAAHQLCRPAFETAGVEVSLRLPRRLGARANPDHLAQVVLNLLQNAARYTPRGGAVVIGAERGADTVLVSLTNSGDIPEADLPHLFERFYRVEKSRDAARGGAGVGLAIVRQLIESSGGRVGVESLGGSTRFWFQLPAGEA